MFYSLVLDLPIKHILVVKNLKFFRHKVDKVKYQEGPLKE
jgi:hypothetical protein